MGRIRSIHPEICESEQLASVSARAERTYTRLWTELDDEGRGRDKPKLLAGRLFPYHDDMDGAAVDEDLDELAAAGLLVRYQVEGANYLAVRGSWDRWQQPSDPKPSACPPPPGQHIDPAAQMTGDVIRARRAIAGMSLRALADVVEVDASHLSRAERGQAGLSYDVRTKLAEYLPPAVDPMLTDVDQRCATRLNGHQVLSGVDTEKEGEKELEGEREEDLPSTPVDADAADPGPDPVVESFEIWWDAYPRRNGKKVGKANALIEWRKLAADQRDRALVGARNLAAAVDADQTLPKDPERFLRRPKGGRGDFPFDDWQTPTQARASPGSPIHVDRHQTGGF